MDIRALSCLKFMFMDHYILIQLSAKDLSLRVHCTTTLYMYVHCPRLFIILIIGNRCCPVLLIIYMTCMIINTI